MKIRPVILCGGAGTRLWPNQKNHQAKQFIDFGGWTLIKKTLERIKNYRIILEPAKKNTAPAILSSALINEIPNDQPLMFFAADHLIEKSGIMDKSLKKNKTNLDDLSLIHI